MADMPISPAHAKPVSRRDHLWVLAIVAAFAFYDVWVAWTQLGNKSGFAHGTGWTLTVIVELYWGYAGFAWLAGAPGLRSRRFAMFSAFGVFGLSLIGQGASYLAVGRTPPVPVVVFVRLLPVIVLALLMVLVHLRHLDRADAEAVAEEAARVAAEAEQVAAAADERVALRAQLDALRKDAVIAIEALEAELGSAVTARDEAQREAAKAVAKTETLTRRLAGNGGRKGTRKPAGKRAATGPGNETRRTAATAPEPGTVTGPGESADVDREALVLRYLDEGKSASEAGRLAGLSDSRGRQIARELAASAPRGQDEEGTA